MYKYKTDSVSTEDMHSYIHSQKGIEDVLNMAENIAKQKSTLQKQCRKLSQVNHLCNNQISTIQFKLNSSLEENTSLVEKIRVIQLENEERLNHKLEQFNQMAGRKLAEQEKRHVQEITTLSNTNKSLIAQEKERLSNLKHLYTEKLETQKSELTATINNLANDFEAEKTSFINKSEREISGLKLSNRNLFESERNKQTHKIKELTQIISSLKIKEKTDSEHYNQALINKENQIKSLYDSKIVSLKSEIVEIKQTYQSTRILFHTQKPRNRRQNQTHRTTPK